MLAVGDVGASRLLGSPRGVAVVDRLGVQQSGSAVELLGRARRDGQR